MLGDSRGFLSDPGQIRNRLFNDADRIVCPENGSFRRRGILHDATSTKLRIVRDIRALVNRSWFLLGCRLYPGGTGRQNHGGPVRCDAGFRHVAHGESAAYNREYRGWLAGQFRKGADLPMVRHPTDVGHAKRG